MPLIVDADAAATLDRIIQWLRTARLDAKLSQDALSERLPVRGRAVSEWESGAMDPTPDHLHLWGRALRRQLVLVSPSGQLVPEGQRLPGETWSVFQRRRLAAPLREHRLACDITQRRFAYRIGVSRHSLHRWEMTRMPPSRSIALVVWAQRLNHTLTLAPI